MPPETESSTPTNQPQTFVTYTPNFRQVTVRPSGVSISANISQQVESVLVPTEYVPYILAAASIFALIIFIAVVRFLCLSVNRMDDRLAELTPAALTHRENVLEDYPLSETSPFRGDDLVDK
jgi:hypothetical protein